MKSTGWFSSDFLRTFFGSGSYHSRTIVVPCSVFVRLLFECCSVFVWSIPNKDRRSTEHGTTMVRLWYDAGTTNTEADPKKYRSRPNKVTICDVSAYTSFNSSLFHPPKLLFHKGRAYKNKAPQFAELLFFYKEISSQSLYRINMGRVFFIIKQQSCAAWNSLG